MLSVIIIAINIFFVYNTVDEWELGPGPVAAIVVGGVIYLIFCVYLAIHMAAAMGSKRLARTPWVQKYVLVSDDKLNASIEF